MWTVWGMRVWRSMGPSITLTCPTSTDPGQHHTTPQSHHLTGSHTTQDGAELCMGGVLAGLRWRCCRR